MRSHQELKKVWGEIKINNVIVLNRTTWKILLVFCFIKLLGSNQTFEDKQRQFKLPRARQAGRKEHAT